MAGKEFHHLSILLPPYALFSLPTSLRGSRLSYFSCPPIFSVYSAACTQLFGILWVAGFSPPFHGIPPFPVLPSLGP